MAHVCEECGKETCQENHGKTMLGIAAVAAVAGAYFLYGKDAEKRRKQVKGWMLKAKGEMLEKMEKLRDIDQEKYNEILETVGEKYRSLKNLDRDDVDTLVAEMKKQWKSIEKRVNKKPAKKRVAKKKTTSKVKKST